MKLQLIQIEAFDNLFSIKEKLIHSKAESLLLIDQTGSPILQNKKQAKLIQRILIKTGKESGVVTQNSTAASILKDVGINYFYDLESAQRFPWGTNKISIQNTWRAKKNQSSFHKNVIKGRSSLAIDKNYKFSNRNCISYYPGSTIYSFCRNKDQGSGA